MTNERPDPDALLRSVNAEAAKRERGRLKIFFGMAPGVGKTFAMLESAQRLREQGVDVVVGWVETHGRADTAALVRGLEDAGIFRGGDDSRSISEQHLAVRLGVLNQERRMALLPSAEDPRYATIRERAKHAAEVAKKSEPTKPEHTGAGTGGGGLGRCPIIVEGDTSVAIKEIDDGVEALVTTKKDVVALQKEAKARAASLTMK